MRAIEIGTYRNEEWDKVSVIKTENGLKATPLGSKKISENYLENLPTTLSPVGKISIQDNFEEWAKAMAGKPSTYFGVKIVD